ncbi:TetR/AcrR family transcriptional regulator [Bacillus sp. JJ722]|uniref:TetR/AcrR family transcriptional regulator n=1 Tax=Bacillus sp. JJ722 TaxID=3122973 RepID=UPI002FFEED74
MSKLTNRQKKAQITKQKILNTALELFSEKGFDHVTIDEIASVSGTSKGAFYVHFQSKYEIFIEKFKEIDGFYTSFMETLPQDLGAHEKILRLIESQMIFLKDSLGKELMRSVYMSGLIPNQDNYFADTDRELYQIVHSIVKKGQASGELTSSLDSSEITMLITRTMRGTLYDWLLFDSGYDLLKESRKFTKALLEGLRGE